MDRESDGQRALVLYDPAVLDWGLREAESTPDVIKGVIVLKRGLHGFYVVDKSAAEKGYGPTLYDAALSLGTPVMPDEAGSVTPTAQNVWRYYATQRSGEVDVTQLPEREHRQPWLNAAYQLRRRVMLPGLRMRHKQYTAHNRRSRDTLERIIWSLGFSFFFGRYKYVRGQGDL